MTIGLLLLVRYFYQESLVDLGRYTPSGAAELNEASRRMDDFFREKSKLIIFLFVRFSAINTFLIFKRKKLNISEHCTISGMLLLGTLLIILFGDVIFLVDLWWPFSRIVGDVLIFGISLSVLVYCVYGLYNAFGNTYRPLGYIRRFMLYFLLLFLEVCIFIFLLYGFVSDWKFGDIIITPVS